MAFTVNVIRGSTTYTISDGAPFSIEMAELVGGASVRTIEESGPYQDGSTHLDNRLEPRTITLKINVVAASASALDGHRDTLNTMFKPVKNVPIILKITRDDGEVRQIDTYRTGPLDIALRPENRPGNLHRAVVQLRAPDPTYYDPTQASESFTPPTSSWWLAYDSIGSANVMEYVESPSQGQAWAHTGSVAAGSPWTIAFRSGSVDASASPADFAFDARGPGSAVIYFRAFAARWEIQGTVPSTGSQASFGSYMTAGTQNYIMSSDGGTISLYRGTTLLDSVVGPSAPIYGTATGTAVWRHTYDLGALRQWPEALPRAAVYNTALSGTQVYFLNNALSAGSVFQVDTVYDGDIDSYPIITIAGSVADPVITNVTTGDVLDFTGGTVGTADTWTIDLRYGRKSALSGTTSVANYLSEASDLSTFRLVADPLASGGTNTITVASTSAGTAASVTLAYYNRYLSY